MSRIGRRVLGAGLMLASTAFSYQASASFPSIVLNITSASGCQFSPGLQSGASAEVTGSTSSAVDLEILFGPMQTFIIFIDLVQFGTSAVPFSGLSFEDGVNFGSGSGSGFATGSQSDVTGFSVSGSGSGSPGCIFSFEASSLALNGGDSSEAEKVLQGVGLLTATNFGPFADTLNALGSIFSSIGGPRNPAAQSGSGRGFHLGKNGLGFSTRGLAAGNGGEVPFGLWGNVTYTDTENDLAATAFDSTRWSGTFGADWNFADRVVVGVAGGYETSDTDTTFNGGEEDVDGWSLVPYIAAVIYGNWSVDAALGYSDLDVDQQVGAVSGSTEAERRFAAAHLNYGQTYGNWNLAARIGVLWAKEDRDAFTDSAGAVTPESSFRVGRFRVGGEISHYLGAWEPFLGALFSHSFQETDVVGIDTDSSDVLVNGGVRYFGAGGLSGSLGVTALLGRDDTEEYSVNLLLRKEF